MPHSKGYPGDDTLSASAPSEESQDCALDMPSQPRDTTRATNAAAAVPRWPSINSLRSLLACRWLLLPCIFTVLIWCSLRLPPAPRAVLHRSLCVHHLSFFNSSASLGAVLPPHPKTMSDTWLLSQLECQLQAATPDSVEEAGVLAKASDILGRPGISREQMRLLPTVIADHESNVGAMQRIKVRVVC